MKQIEHFTELKKLTTLDFVCQTGGNNQKVKWHVQGLESFVIGCIFFGKLPLTKKGIVNVFDSETHKWLGQIKRAEYDIPTRFEADEELYFDDFYTQG